MTTDIYDVAVIGYGPTGATAANLLGQEGDGWNQVMSELAFERSGPERFLSSIELMYQLIERDTDHSDSAYLNEIIVPIQATVRSGIPGAHSHPHARGY